LYFSLVDDKLSKNVERILGKKIKFLERKL